MDYQLRIQDPTEPPRSPLFDVIVQLVSEGTVTSGRWLFGFLTGSGMDVLLAVPQVTEVLHNANFEITVGIDAVTDRAGLERLQQISAVNPNFSARVIKNTTGVLIHPKLLLFEYDDGRGALVVGSNNLSANGLSGNVEGYSILRYSAQDAPDFADWDAFLARWTPLLAAIDQDAMERAERNERRMAGVSRVVRTGLPSQPPGGVVVSDGQAHEAPSEIDEKLYEPMLVAQIPKASGRWPQVHYSADIISRYFNAVAGDEVLLREHAGILAESRQVVYSQVNKNFKIELGAAGEAQRAVGYPATGRPVALFRREGASDRRHRYILLMPGDPGHTEMAQLASQEFSGPGNQVPRVIVPRNRVLAAWPHCPL